MQRTCERLAGLDVHKDLVVACAQVLEGNKVTVHKSRFGTTTAQVVLLGEWMADLGVTRVAMEASGVYWKPIVRHEAPSNREEVQGLLRRTVAAVR